VFKFQNRLGSGDDSVSYKKRTKDEVFLSKIIATEETFVHLYEPELIARRWYAQH
jgi:hypothetical protein